MQKTAREIVQRAFAKVDRPDMYNLVASNKLLSAELRLIPFIGLMVYSYTFSYIIARKK